jgi:hypothetical protein
MDEASAILGIGVCLFAFLAVLLGIGSFYGGDWQLVAQGITQFFLIIVGFSFGAYVLIKIMEKR